MAKKKKEELEEAMFWHKERNGVRDLITPREEFIPVGKTDFSGTRENRNNKLYALNFGRIVALNTEKIEKSNLFHFFPNSISLFIGLPGCNVKSPFCSDFELYKKQLHENPLGAKYQYYTPEQIIGMAEKKNLRIVTFNYTEPFIFFEFAFRTAKNAHRANIKTTMVTNAYTMEEPIKKIGKYIDAVTVKIFGSMNADLYHKYMAVNDVDSIYTAIKQFQKQKMFIEITNLIVPQIGDSLEECKNLAAWISHELGAETPFHLLQFQPNGISDIMPTPIATLERFAEESRKEGLRYVYIHSAPPHQEESSYCHNCRELIIERKNSVVKKSNLKDDRCPNCGFKLNFIK